MPNYGVHASEQATSVSTPVLADVAVPYVVGTAPVHMAAKPAEVGVPVLCTSWDEAVQKLGFSYDWRNYTLCEFMYSHFQLYTQQPVIFCNVMDPAKQDTGVQPATYALNSKKIATLPQATRLSTLQVCRPDVDPDTQSYRIRPKDAKTDYPALYEAAGVTMRDGGIFYTQGKDLPDEALKHEASGTDYYVGIVYPKPEGAKKVKISDNYGNVDEKARDLEGGNDENVLDGNPIDYYPFADQTGKPTETKMWINKLEWFGDTEDTPIATTVCTVAVGQTVHAVEDEDYTAWNDENTGEAFVQCSADGVLGQATEITIEADSVTPEEVDVTDIVAGIGAIDACLNKVGKVPDLIVAPGWSHLNAVSAIMAAKASSISNLFSGKAIIDIDTTEVTDYSQVIEYKNQNNLVDENEILCWPLVKSGDYVFHLSTQLTGLMAKVDSGNNSVPYEVASNKNLTMDACVLEDGTEVNLTLEQANILRDNAIVTAMNAFSGWVAWGAYTACYPANTDVKDYMIPISRMFDYIKGTVIKTFWSKIDKPMNRRLIDNIVDTCNLWLNGLTSSGYLLGARAEVKDEENPLLDLMQGIIRVHLYVTPPSPLQECDFILEYDPSYVEAAFAS